MRGSISEADISLKPDLPKTRSKMCAGVPAPLQSVANLSFVPDKCVHTLRASTPTAFGYNSCHAKAVRGLLPSATTGLLLHELLLLLELLLEELPPLELLLAELPPSSSESQVGVAGWEAPQPSPSSGPKASTSISDIPSARKQPNRWPRKHPLAPGPPALQQ